MSQAEGTLAASVGLVDIVDRLLSRGTVLVGESMISLAGVDLVYLKLNLLLASVAALKAGPSDASREGAAPAVQDALSGAGAGRQGRAPFAPEAAVPRGGRSVERPYEPRSVEGPYDDLIEPAARPAGEGASPDRGLAQLVLTLVELLRQLVERQAIRRVDAGGLSDDQVERMGLALRDLEARMVELREVFGLEETDINVDLGPLGKLL